MMMVIAGIADSNLAGDIVSVCVSAVFCQVAVSASG